jgi:hypothetical protein
VNSGIRILSVAIVLAAIAIVAGHSVVSHSADKQTTAGSATSYLGFDLNIYPGDDALSILKRTFSFTSYWLSAPPEEKQSSWLGKRKLLEHQGLGFVVLFNARASRKIKTEQTAKATAALDAERAAKLALQEGFPKGIVIFLDVEIGGRLPAPYEIYVQTWFEDISSAGFRPGVYCSGIPVKEAQGALITTAEDILAHAGAKKIVFWVYNDTCPPSRGCTFPKTPPGPSASGTDFAAVWQYARSPRNDFAVQCPANYAPDGNCYAPGDESRKWLLDANVASTPDPSSAK